MNLAPIVFFVYNRPWHTQQTLEALTLNEGASESVLYVFADGAKEGATDEEIAAIKETRALLRSQQWCSKVVIVERKVNVGLAQNISEGINEVLKKHDRIIVLEDDIVTSPKFLNYMNDALSYYKDMDEVMHISGYIPRLKGKLPSFFFYNQTSCWGWGTWKNSWSKFSMDTEALRDEIITTERVSEFNLNDSYNFLSHLDMNINGKLNTWAIKWHASVFLQKGLCLHPSRSYVKNIGFDDSGVHCKTTDVYDVDHLNLSQFKPVKFLEESKRGRLAMTQFHSPKKKEYLLIKRVLRRLKKIIKNG